MKTLPHFIDGHEVAEGTRQPKRSPADSRWLAETCMADDTLVNCAVQSARLGLAGPWGRLRADERSDLLERTARLLDGARQQPVALEIEDTGEPLAMARQEIARVADNFRTSRI